MNDVDSLTELFTRFPGIGPRQARRFVYFLLRQDEQYRERLIRGISRIAEHISQCELCLRFAPLHAKQPLCDICADTNRDTTVLMLVEKDMDVEQMEKSGAYNGRYFVLGGTYSLAGKKNYLRDKELEKRLKSDTTLTEIILALSTTADGEYTTDVLRESLPALIPHATITMLGRGLSTGAELEYADPQTLTQALKNRG